MNQVSADGLNRFAGSADSNRKHRVWAKICGLRDEVSARAVAEMLPQAIGLNFYPRSSRFIDDLQAQRVVADLPDAICRVGVFVNASTAEIVARVHALGLHAVQFHGDESAADIREFHQLSPQTAIIVVIRFGTEGLQPELPRLSQLAAEQVPIAACLIDAQVSGSYGGTGAQVPWGQLRDELDRCSLPPVILAGGLNPENVATAIQQVRPWGVDVASGVESSPGVKDPKKVAAFLAACRSR
ncbi:N-(5'-phosphoribosyl)anthranilate isomerase [bacterium]|nr:N-(5'-phosphoribosyl)anthranilate isomerase [bacterium]